MQAPWADMTDVLYCRCVHRVPRDGELYNYIASWQLHGIVNAVRG